MGCKGGGGAHTAPARALIKPPPPPPCAGDVADEVEADLVLLSTEAVHAKHVDANQLAEFVSCPLMLLP